MAELPPFVSVDQLAKRWQVSGRTIRRMVEAGKLRAIRINNQLRIARQAVELYERTHEVANWTVSGLSGRVV
jgi:excisionase family DNA binding protein